MMRTRVDTPIGPCLDDNVIAALLDGELSAGQRKRVEVHVDRCDECRALLAELVGDGHATQPLLDGSQTLESPNWNESQVKPSERWLQRVVASASLLDAGAKINHYTVLRLLGVGGMGEVYLARDDKLGRKVAIELVSDRLLESPGAVERFMREARATARVNHPNIVTVHGVGEHQGKPYLALEYVRGDTLRRWMQKHPNPPLEEVLNIGLAIAEALAEAHRHGILHRDLKPENVLVEESGRVRVVDFGLAEIVEGDDALMETAHEHSQPLGPLVTGIVGTPRYMAPEQWLEEDRSGATDVWAAGLILYELLSGSHPYRDVATMMDLATAICGNDPVPALSSAATPDELSHIVSRSLLKDVARRPSAEDLAAVLRKQSTRIDAEALLEESSLELQPPPPSRAWMVWAAAALAFGGLAAVLFLRHDPLGDDAAATTVTPSVTATSESAAATAVVPSASPPQDDPAPSSAPQDVPSATASAPRETPVVRAPPRRTPVQPHDTVAPRTPPKTNVTARKPPIPDEQDEPPPPDPPAGEKDPLKKW